MCLHERREDDDSNHQEEERDTKCRERDLMVQSRHTERKSTHRVANAGDGVVDACVDHCPCGVVPLVLATNLQGVVNDDGAVVLTRKLQKSQHSERLEHLDNPSALPVPTRVVVVIVITAAREVK